jgi:hypothetical protein
LGKFSSLLSAGVINPAFIAFAVMLALFIPVLIVDLYFPSRPED